MALPRVIFVLGPPGAGKGTQCARLVEKFGFGHLSAGELLRNEVRDSGPDGSVISGIMKEGKIVPSSITVNLLSRAMCKLKKDTFLIDGFPRNEENLKAWNDAMATKAKVRFMLFYSCSEAICVERVINRAEGRADDTEEIVRKRIQQYRSSTLPVIEGFRVTGLLREVDGGRGVEEIFTDTQALVDADV